MDVVVRDKHVPSCTQGCAVLRTNVSTWIAPSCIPTRSVLTQASASTLTVPTVTPKIARDFAVREEHVPEAIATFFTLLKEQGKGSPKEKRKKRNEKKRKRRKKRKKRKFFSQRMKDSEGAMTECVGFCMRCGTIPT